MISERVVEHLGCRKKNWHHYRWLNFQFYFAGAEKGIDEYYRQQEEMLEGFEEMDTIAERGYMPSTTQVS